MNSNIKFLGVDSTKVDLKEKKDFRNNGVTEYYTAEEIARPYKVYKALLSQGETNAPTAIVLENTLGNIVWTRNNVGTYVGTLTGAFVGEKVFCIISQSGSAFDFPEETGYKSIGKFNNNQIRVATVVQTSLNNFSPTDGLLNNTAIEIQVYP
jgi:hypothetical protein